MRLLILKSSVISLLSCLVTFPYFYYLVFRVSPAITQKDYSNPWGLLLTELFLLLIVCLLASTSGLVFASRYGLPGFWGRKPYPYDIMRLILIGGGIVYLSYILFDRHFYLISPLSYPRGIVYLITLPLKGALTEEVILRLCMVTLVYGLLKKRFASIVVVSFLSSMFGLQYFKYIGVDLQAGNLFITQLLLSFTANFILGYLFITKGLVHSMIMKFILCMKYPFINLLMV